MTGSRNAGSHVLFARLAQVAIAVGVVWGIGHTLMRNVPTSAARAASHARQPRDQPEAASAPAAAPQVSIHDALHKPFDLPFAEPTPLEEVATQLQKRLGGHVVLDRAALIRLELEPTDTVQLELQGVRLKTSLQLLLDQVGMTYRLVPEDNLLILTDAEGSEDPFQTVLAEIDILHRELHEVRAALSALAELLPAGAPPAGMHNPTLIEELPAEDSGRPKPDSETPPARRKPASIRRTFTR